MTRTEARGVSRVLSSASLLPQLVAATYVQVTRNKSRLVAARRDRRDLYKKKSRVIYHVKELGALTRVLTMTRLETDDKKGEDGTSLRRSASLASLM